MSSFNHRGTARMQLLGALVAIAVGLLVVAPLAAPRANAAALGAVHGSVLGINDTPDSGYDDPLPGVRVAVFDAGTGAFLTGTDTDALGEYRIGSLPTKPLKIRFTKTGWLTTWRPDTVTPVAGSTLELGEIAVYAEAVVSGQVLSSMDPIGGARVTVFDATTGAVLAAKQLGEYEYEYRIGQLPAGQIKVRATKPGYITAWAGPYTLVAGQQLAQSWDPMILYLDMAPATTMTGTVIGQNTATATTGPLAGVQVLLVDTTTGNGVAAVTTDANGAYRFKALAPGPTVTVVFTKDGWLKTRYPQPVELYPYRTPIDLGQTTMTAEAVVSGQVLSSMDPIGGARVTVFDATTGAVLAAKQLGEHEYEYRIGQLPAGQIKVRATKPGYITAWANYPAGTFAQAKTYTLVSGQVLEQSWSPNADLYLDLAPATTMTGTVIGQNTATATTGPLAGVQVLLVDTTTGNGVAAVTTDANGAYRFKALAPGPTVTVVFTKDGWLKTRYPQPVELYPYRTRIDLGQTTMTAEAVVSGQVLSSMDPIGGARVTVFDATTGAVLAAKQLGEHEYEYRIGQLPAGQIKVRATKPGYITAWANYPAGTFAQAKTYTLESGQVLEQSWSPNADLYLDLQPKS